MDKYFFILQNISTRYALIAGIAFVIFYFFFKNKTGLKKIQSKFPQQNDIRREILYSASAMLIFALVPALVVFDPHIRPHTLIYTDPQQYGIFYLIFSFVLMYFVHDAYFYWAHRLMHHPKLFKYFHLVHHKSTNPSPWAAYAFHPLESFVEVGIYFIFAFCFPVYIINFGLFFLFQIVYNVYGHLGYELYPRNFNRHPVGKWINTSVAHNQHHQHFTGNYGLYTLIWDRLMHTLRDDYDAKYDEVKGN